MAQESTVPGAKVRNPLTSPDFINDVINDPALDPVTKAELLAGIIQLDGGAPEEQELATRLVKRLLRSPKQ